MRGTHKGHHDPNDEFIRVGEPLLATTHTLEMFRLIAKA